MRDLSRHDIRIGTLVNGGATTGSTIRQILPHGFESFSITFWQRVDVDLERLAGEVREALGDSGAVISSLGVFGNSLSEEDDSTRAGWEALIDSAHLFGSDIVAGFTGRNPGSIPDNIPRFKTVYDELARRAADRGVKIAFENCSMGGDWKAGEWNIAHCPKAWELMFDAVPADNIGLQWEPCHQMVLLMDPIAQLRKWAPKVVHVHGKDATVAWDVVREEGIGGPNPFAWHRTPGFGDTNWTDVISILRQNGYRGSIDIEGWHDPVYRDELEMTGQVRGLNYLKDCRGGDFVPNPA